MPPTLEARLARLEASPPAPSDVPAWLRAAPDAVIAYINAAIRDTESLAQADARHPLLDGLLSYLDFWQRSGYPITLRRLQQILIWKAEHALGDARKAPERRYPSQEDRAAALAAFWPGVPEWDRFAAWQGWGEAEDGDAFVRLWRTRGTRDPETTAQAGLHAEELALLAADEGGGIDARR